MKNKNENEKSIFNEFTDAFSDTFLNGYSPISETLKKTLTDENKDGINADNIVKVALTGVFLGLFFALLFKCFNM